MDAETQIDQYEAQRGEQPMEQAEVDNSVISAHKKTIETQTKPPTPASQASRRNIPALKLNQEVGVQKNLKSPALPPSVALPKKHSVGVG